MPHSISPEASPAEEDSLLPDAPPEPLAEETDGHESENSPSRHDQNETPTRVPKSAEVKLEDLFNTDDEDDEFPTSSAPDGTAKVEGSSPPAAPV